MDRTPSVSRSSSRSSLEDLSESDSKELEKQGEKKPGGAPNDSNASSKMPSTSSRPLQRTGTWSQGRMPVDKGQMRSNDPVLSPRTGASKKPVLLPSSTTSSTPVHPSTSQPAPAPSISTSTLPSAPAKGPSGNIIFATDLSQKVISSVNASLGEGAHLSPERVGEVLVAVESKGKRIPLVGDVVSRILRGGLVIRDFEPASGGKKQEFNVIAKICEPFMFRHLVTPELEKSRKQVVSDFTKIAPAFADLAGDTQPRDWMKSADMQKLMDPIMTPVMRIVCGDKNTLDTSELPEKVKALLLSIDKHIIDWFNTHGSGKPRDLYEARKNALVAFIATRALSSVWKARSAELADISDKHLLNLIRYMNSYLTKQTGDFVNDVLLNQEDQPIAARRYIEILTKKTTLKSKPSMPTLALGKTSTLSGKGILSARIVVPSAHQGQGMDKSAAEKKAEKEAKTKLMKMRVERANFMDEIAKAAGLDDIDFQCFQYVKTIVVKMQERGFRNFQKDPVKSCKKYAAEFYAKTENHERVKKGLPAKTANALDAWRLKLVGNPFEEDGEGDIKSASSITKASHSSATEESSETEPSDETEIRTESSE